MGYLRKKNTPLATNKHAVIRYQALDKCFRNSGRKYYIEDLIEACCTAIYDYCGDDKGISRRQIIDDINFMESEHGWCIPLQRIKDGRRVFYCYEDKSYSINNQPLNETEENQLKEALLTLSRFKGMPQFEWVDEISARLDSELDLSHSNEKIIDFEQNQFLRGLEFITPLYNSILYKKAISINYQSFKQPLAISITFHPYFLKQYNNRWYVFGQNHENQFVMNLALDRIESIHESKLKYTANKEIDFNEYFEDLVGVTLPDDGALENILLEVSNDLLPYILTKPLHGSQKLKDKGSKTSTITIDVVPNFELESLILSHGEGIKVTKPTTLRNRIKKRVKAMFDSYI